jgi:hypothetical protein
MSQAADWSDLLQHAAGGDHIVQAWQDESFLADCVAAYVGAALRAGEAALVVSTPAHFELFKQRLPEVRAAARSGQLRWLDAGDTLARLLHDGMQDWKIFQQEIGGLIAELRLQYPTVRIYGEMVDLLWRRGERDAAIRLEEFWNELGKLQTFSLFCTYQLDALDAQDYGPLQCVCQVHTHLIPVRDYDAFNHAVTDASREILEQPLAQMLSSLASSQRSSTEMPLGQAKLLWLHKNMPRTAEKVLAGVRQRYATG